MFLGMRNQISKPAVTPIAPVGDFAANVSPATFNGINPQTMQFTYTQSDGDKATSFLWQYFKSGAWHLIDTHNPTTISFTSLQALTGNGTFDMQVIATNDVGSSTVSHTGFLTINAPTTQTFNSSSTFTPTTTNIQVDCWGGGGGGSKKGGGGASGDFSRSTLSVLTGTAYTVTIGAGGTANGGAGGDTWFNTNTTMIAKGGVGGTSAAGGSGTANSGLNIGDVRFHGGSGANPTSPAGGGGGGAPGSVGNGGNASGTFGGTGVGGGGNGGTGGSTGTMNGTAGAVPGSGGGGGGTTSGSGAAGSTGRQVISW